MKMAHVSFPNGFERLPKRLVYAHVNVQRRTFQMPKVAALSYRMTVQYILGEKKGELMLHVNIHRSLILKKRTFPLTSHIRTVRQFMWAPFDVTSFKNLNERLG